MRISDWSSDVCSSDLSSASTNAGTAGPPSSPRSPHATAPARGNDHLNVHAAPPGYRPSRQATTRPPDPASRLRHRLAFDALLDGAEDRVPLPVEHLDAHGIAEPHEGRHRLALLPGLDGALLGEARRAQAGVLVCDGDRAADRDRKSTRL